MTSQPLLLAAFLASTLTLAVCSRAEGSDRTPAQLIVNLENLQTEIAQGDKAASVMLPKALDDLAASFATANPATWGKVRISDAAVVYLSSGGRARPVAGLLENGAIPKADENVVRGALAYALGRDRVAEKLLGGLDPRTFDLRVAGHLALIQSMLIAATDKTRAIAFLDLARLLATGGLVEEAAMRREILLLAELHDVDRFLLLSRQYMNRYPHSVYADAFLKAFPATVVRFGLADDLVDFQKFDRFPTSFAPEQQSRLYLSIARAALVNGRIEVAAAASAKGLSLAKAGSVDEAQAQFYQSASRMLGEEYDLGVVELQGVNTGKLAKGDVALIRAVKNLAAHLHEAPKIAETPPANQEKAPTKPGLDDPVARSIQLAEAAIEDADNLLGGVKQ